MYYCQLSTQQNQWNKLDQVSHCFHGLLERGTGLRWCQLDLLLELPPGSPQGQAAVRALLPAAGDSLIGLQFYGGGGKQYTGLNRSLETTARWTLRCRSVESLALRLSGDQWFRGFWVSLEFSPTATNAFDLGTAGSEIPVWKPELASGTLTARECLHGSSVRFDAAQQNEYLHDFQVHESRAEGNVYRHEKESTQINSLLGFALSQGHNMLANKGGIAPAPMTLTYRQPVDPSTETGRKATGGEQVTRIDATFQCGAVAAAAAAPDGAAPAAAPASLKRLHFAEVTGLFKNAPLPALREYLDPGKPGVADQDYWLSSLDAILAGRAGREGRGGADVPHEFITLVLG